MDLILTDPPYGLVFMSKEWDRETPAVEVWLECFRVLKPGGFILVMASPRNDDLVSVSLREAGFVKHNSIYHVFGSGFPKGSDCGKMIDAKAVRAWLSQHDHGLTSKEVNQVVSAAVNGEFEIPRPAKDVTGISYSKIDKTTYGINPDRTAGALLISQLEEKYGSMPKRVKVGEKAVGIKDGACGGSHSSGMKNPVVTITAPATPLAKEFKGMKYGIQALKPAAEVILVFQKPFEGSPLENILKWRVGCINVDAGRISSKDFAKCSGVDKGFNSKGKYSDFSGGNPQYAGSGATNPQGRYPSNFLLSHVPPSEFSPGCRVVGERRVKGAGWRDEDKGLGKAGVIPPMKPLNENCSQHYADADGKETVRQYECVEGCSVAELDRQSASCHTSGTYLRGNKPTPLSGSGMFGGGRKSDDNNYFDTGTASRFFYQPEWGPADFIYQAKASSCERSSGCEAHEEIEIEFKGADDIWDGRDRKVKLRVDTATSPPRVIGVSTTGSKSEREWSTWLFGSGPTALFRPDIAFTIKTATSSTTASRTLNWLLSYITREYTAAAKSGTVSGGSLVLNAAKCNLSLNITKGRTVYVPGAGDVVLKEPLKISVSVKEGDARVGNPHPT